MSGVPNRGIGLRRPWDARFSDLAPLVEDPDVPSVDNCQRMMSLFFNVCSAAGGILAVIDRSSSGSCR